MKKEFLILMILFLFTSMNIYGQPSMQPDSSTLEAMERLSFLEGEWSGEGWIQMGRDKYEFSQKETVETKVNNTVVVIEGKGLDAETKQVIHQAFAVISYDAANQKYLMRAFRADGHYIDADAEVDENGSFIWGFTHPMAGQIRYTINLDDGQWIETGEINRDGSNWFPFFGMKLSRE